jgi:D-alanyl-lipoteichoic acid acyltransferase DltB (MBOAT superfamily)
MLFNSVAFLIFFPIVTLLYFALPHGLRWVLLLLASCVFYMYFIPVFILILAFTILVDYVAGILIHKTEGKQRTFLLGLSIAANVGVLAVFKYFNFANSNLDALAQAIGWNYPIAYLDLVLPIGLSFHTFQAMSYTIEVYRRQQAPEYHLGIYSLYVLFYPQLVAGPIERPQNLLHQFRTRHEFDGPRATQGLKRMLWGLFKKMVIADNLALLVNQVYANPDRYSGLDVLVPTYLFAIQIYCDFSGYSDIALGSAKVMGFTLMENFDRPYFATTISEFWRRWHISLSTWFRDYLYIPLGGSRVGPWRWSMNIMTIFLLSGLWHGANWTFLIWGGLHGLFFILHAITTGWRNRLTELLGLNRAPQLLTFVHGLVTFNLVCLAWVFFRADSLTHALLILRKMVRITRHSQLSEACAQQPLILYGCVGAVLLLVFEAWQANRHSESAGVHLPRAVRWAGYYALIASILLLGNNGAAQFIYFQF